MSIPDAEMLIRLAEILEVSVSELLGEKLESEPATNDIAEQLSRINEQLAVKNRRSRRMWKIIGIALAAMVGIIFLIVVAMVVFFSVPNRNLNPENIRTTVSNEVITKPVE